jgi:farnesyl-diphosphate farnesyltransferase
MTSSSSASISDARLHELLVGSSRTFALAIPQLPARLRRDATISYLLFRIADTFEDANEHWSRERQLGALGAFERLLLEPTDRNLEVLAEISLRERPTTHGGYLDLLSAVPEVISSWKELPEASMATIGEHTRRTTRRMARFVARADGQGVLRLESLDDLRAYCYAVAGIVGELLTELFVLHCPELESVSDELGRRAAPFGEGLQLVNILKDSAGDEIEGRNFLPPGVAREEIFRLARHDLDEAAEYCLAVQSARAPGGIVAFVALPVELAWATLDRVESRGPGAKISRATVFRLYGKVRNAIATGAPVLTRRDTRSSE